MNAEALIWWLLTIIIIVSIWSWLYKDNLLFRIAQRTFVAFGAAHYFNLALVSLKNMAYVPIFIKADYLRLIPVVLGILTWFIMTKKYYWLNRYGLLVLIAITTNLSLTGMVPSMITGQFLPQLKALYSQTTIIGTVWAYLQVIIIVLIMSYFFFIWLKKPTASMAKAGRFVLMSMFGILFGSSLIGLFIQMVHMFIEVFMMKWPF